MSDSFTNAPASAFDLYRGAPYVGALLRMASNVSRERSLRVLKERAFDDLNQALLSGFQWPPPEGVRPIDLAERANMTRQSANYLIRELEQLGYMERRAERPGGRRLVYLTRRGWKVFEAIWTAQKQLHEEWATIVGPERFEEFMRTLRQLSMIDAGGKTTSPSPPLDAGRRARRRSSGTPRRRARSSPRA